jgi:hypothetical protein
VTTARRPPKAGILATGVAGRIALHYWTAADVAGFVVERDEAGVLSLRAHVANADEFKLTQQPLSFIVTLQHGAWHWPIEQILTYRDHAILARLGPPIAQKGTSWAGALSNPRLYASR